MISKLSIRAKCILAALLPFVAAVLIWAAAARTSLSAGAIFAVAVGSGAVISLLATSAVTSSLSTRIKGLKESAAVIANGAPIRSLDASHDELGELAGALVQMSRQVIEQKAELADVSAHLEAVLRATTEVCILGEDLKGKITICNPGAEKLLGYSKAELMGR